MTIGVSSGGGSLGSTIETGELADDAVTSAKIKDANITLAKMGVKIWHVIETISWTTDTTSAEFEDISGDDYSVLHIIGNVGDHAAALTGMLYINEDTTDANYGTERYEANGANVTAELLNAPYFAWGPAGKPSMFELMLWEGIDGYVSWRSHGTYGGTGRFHNFYGGSDGVLGEIQDIELVMLNALDTGTVTLLGLPI